MAELQLGDWWHYEMWRQLERYDSPPLSLSLIDMWLDKPYYIGPLGVDDLAKGEEEGEEAFFSLSNQYRSQIAALAATATKRIKGEKDEERKSDS